AAALPLMRLSDKSASEEIVRINGKKKDLESFDESIRITVAASASALLQSAAAYVVASPPDGAPTLSLALLVVRKHRDSGSNRAPFPPLLPQSLMYTCALSGLIELPLPA